MKIASSLRSRLPAPVVALALGATLGILGPLLEAAGNSAGHVASLVLSAGWAWAALAFCVGLARKSRMESALLAPASLLVAVIAYYLTKLGQGEFRTLDPGDVSGRTTRVDWSGLLAMPVYWCVAACVLGCLLGMAGNLARSRGLRGLPFQVLIPLTAIVETTQRIHFEAPWQGSSAAMTWTVIRLMAAAGILALAVIAWRSRRSAQKAASGSGPRVSPPRR